jgi:histidinol-phosphate aminotransferase
LNERKRLEERLLRFDLVEKVYPSEANFVLAKVTDANNVYEYLIRRKIVVRNRSNVELCDGCLRMTVGTVAENDCLLRALSEYGGLED